MVKKVTTCLEDSVWKDAMFNDISWSRALKLGIEILLGGKMETQKLQEEKISLEMKLTGIKKRMTELKEAEKDAAKNEKTILKNLELLGKSAEIVKTNIATLNGRTRGWNRKTGMTLTPNTFLKLCERYSKGEFDNNGVG